MAVFGLPAGAELWLILGVVPIRFLPPPSPTPAHTFGT